MSIDRALTVLLIWTICPMSSLAQTAKSDLVSSHKAVNVKAKRAIEAPARIESHGPKDLSKAQLWAIACPALLDQMNGYCHDRLATKASTVFLPKERLDQAISILYSKLAAVKIAA